MLPTRPPPPMMVTFMVILSRSNRPIRDPQPGNLREVRTVPGKERRVVNQDDGGNSQIHRSQARLELAQALKLHRSGIIKGKDFDRSVIGNVLYHLSIGLNQFM